jgi:hypothetical protein
MPAWTFDNGNAEKNLTENITEISAPFFFSKCPPSYLMGEYFEMGKYSLIVIRCDT